MATHIHTSRQGACTRLSGPHSLQSEDAIAPPRITAEIWLATLVAPVLMVIALAGFAQPEVLRHDITKPHSTVIALAEGAR